VRKTSISVDHIEDQLLSSRLSTNRAELGAARRVLVRLQRLLAPEPGSLLRLLNRPPQWLQKEDVKELRKSTEEFALIINDLMALGERIKLLQEEIAANLNEQSNRTLFTLTVVTVLALPINIIAGFFWHERGRCAAFTGPGGVLDIGGTGRDLYPDRRALGVQEAQGLLTSGQLNHPNTDVWQHPCNILQ
jgi:zinc transporter